MQSYTGEIQDSAAGSQPEYTTPSPVEFSAQQETQAFSPVDYTPPAPAPELNPQSEHFRALREEVDRLKAEKNELKENFELMRANVTQQYVAPQPVAEKPMFDGLKDDDIPNVGEFRKAIAQREAEYQARIEELQVQQQYSDYAQVLRDHTLPLVKEKPHLAQGIQGAQNKALYAYELGKLRQQAMKPAAPAPSPVAERVIANSKKPGSLSGAGGQGALSQADYFAKMSDQEFMQFASKHLEGI